MLLKTFRPAVACRDEQLNDFLSQDQNDARKLGPCPVTELRVLQEIGSGGEGLVLKCSSSQSSDPVALKLFFIGQQPLDQHSWPLRDEALYYASCAHKRAQYSDPSHSLPSLPRLPYIEWARQNDQLPNQELFDVIKENIRAAPPEAVEREKILPLLDKMCARGWVAFKVDILRDLQKVLSLQQTQHLVRFTGNVIIGIVKPFFEKEDLSERTLERQTQTMLLMREFGWRLKEFKHQNWINGYLVDGGDVDIEPPPRHSRPLEKSWFSRFYQLIKQHTTQVYR